MESEERRAIMHRKEATGKVESKDGSEWERVNLHTKNSEIYQLLITLSFLSTDAQAPHGSLKCGMHSYRGKEAHDSSLGSTVALINGVYFGCMIA
jgi:hypothetical protein